MPQTMAMALPLGVQSPATRFRAQQGPQLNWTLRLLQRSFKPATAAVVAAAGRRSRILYDDSDTYVLIEPGEDEVFVSEEQLRARLKSWLEAWPNKRIPLDLEQLGTLDAAVDHLVTKACELDLGNGLGSLQWFQVRLE